MLASYHHVESFSKNEVSAINYFYNLYNERLCEIVGDLTHDPLVSQKIVKDTFIKSWYRDNNYLKTQEDIRAFLFITTRNTCLNYLRSIKKNDSAVKENLLARIDHLIPYSPGDNNAPDSSPYTKETFKLAYANGLSEKEIAAKLNIPVMQVKQNLELAMRHLAGIFMPKQEMLR